MVGTPRKRAIFNACCIFVIIVTVAIFGAYVSTSTTSYLGNSPTFTNSSLGLRLAVSTNQTQIASGQYLSVNFTLENVLPRTNNVSIKDQWTFPTLDNYSSSTLPVCGRGEIAFNVYSGYYSISNVSSAKPLPLIYYSALPVCPVYNVHYLVFQPLSDNVTLYGDVYGLPSLTCVTYCTSVSFSMNGYYLSSLPPASAGANSTGQKLVFEPGVYTILGGDEWGDAVITHFTVT